MNKKEIKLAKEYIDRDLEEYFIYDEYMENIPLAVKDYNECKLEITILKQVIKELNKLWMIT